MFATGYLVNPPTFLDVLKETRSPQFIRDVQLELTTKEGRILGLGFIAIALLTIGPASTFAAIALTGLSCTMQRVLQGARKYVQIKNAEVALSKEFTTLEFIRLVSLYPEAEIQRACSRSVSSPIRVTNLRPTLTFSV